MSINTTLLLVFFFVLTITASKDSLKESSKFAYLGKKLLPFLMGGLISATVLVSSSNAVFDTASDIPLQYFKEKREISGEIVKILDGDTYRLRHNPKFLMFFELNKNKDKITSKNTISVRIAAVDTPEIPKFGNPGQKFANEAVTFASNKLLGKQVTVKLLSKDQYGRVVGLVLYKEPLLFGFGAKKDISEELLKEGLAVVYRQGGAQYDGSVEKWNAIENDAIKHKKNIWKNGRSKAELPSDYKKKLKVGNQ